MLAFIGWRLWRLYDKRRTAREAGVAREAALLAEMAVFKGVGGGVADAAGRGRPVSPASGQPAGAQAPRPAVQRPEVQRPELAPAGVPEGRAQERLQAATGAYLSRRQTLVYRLLRLAWAEGEVFPRASLRGVLGPDAVGKDLRLDFVLCDQALRVVAAVDVVRDGDLSAVEQLKREKLGAAKIVYLRLDAAALPGADELRRSLGAGSPA